MSDSVFLQLLITVSLELGGKKITKDLNTPSSTELKECKKYYAIMKYHRAMATTPEQY